jgi:hypothetical protein
MTGEFNPHSGDWKMVRAWVSAHIAKRGIELEQDGLNHERTQFLRGEIASLKALVGNFDPTPLPEVKDDPHYG